MSFVLSPKISCCNKELSPPPIQARQRRYTAVLASHPIAKHDAYRLRYDSYLDQGHIQSNPGRLFKDHWDDLDNSRTVVLYDDVGAVGSVRVCLLGWPGLTSPASEAFPDALTPLLAELSADTFAAEITRLVRSPASANDQALVFILYRLANYIGFVERVGLLLASVRRNHAIFYKRLGFRVASEQRPYPGLTCPMQLLSCDRAAYERSFARFPLIDPFGPGADRLDGLLDGATVTVSLLPNA